MVDKIAYILILFLYPFIFFDIFLTTWLRIPPHLILILVILASGKFFTSKRLVYLVLIFVALQIGYSLLYMGSFKEFVVNFIKIMSAVLLVQYFYYNNKTDKFILFSVALSLASYGVYLISFVNPYLNIFIRSLIFGDIDMFQARAGLAVSQYTFGYHIIVGAVFFLLKKPAYKIVGILMVILSPQRSVLSSFLVFIHIFKKNIVIVIVSIIIVYANFIMIKNYVVENSSFSIFAKEEVSSQSSTNRLDMIISGVEIILHQPQGAIIGGKSWGNIVEELNIIEFMDRDNSTIAPHNFILYLLFIFGLIPGLLLLFLIFKPFLAIWHIDDFSFDKLFMLFVSIALITNSFFHNASLLTAHTVSLIFYSYFYLMTYEKK